jgi:phosphate transport system substrate-binding protein
VEATVFNKSVVAAAVATIAFSPAALAQTARDYISIAGSSTVFPFSSAVAEQFGKAGRFKTPKVESVGTGGGIKLFCQGVGVQYTDVANASRRIKPAELQACQKNGVKDVAEIRFGFDGIVLANAKKAPVYKLSRRDIYLALAKQVPDANDPNKLIANPYKTWKDVNKDLPGVKIEVLGPPPTSGTRDAFVELVMEVGCKKYDFVKAMEATNKDGFKKACMTVREDGAYIEAGENDNLIVQKLAANKNAYGIFGFSFLEENTDKIQGSEIEGHAPTFEKIASGAYTVSRPLFFYVKKAHVDVIPGIREYLAEFTSEKAWGKDGYLAERGMIPMPDAERKQYAAAAKDLALMTGEGLH